MVNGLQESLASIATQPFESGHARGLAERVLDRTGDLAVELRDLLLAKDEMYATSDRVAPDELMRSLEDNLRRLLESLAGVVPEGVAVLDAVRLTAIRRADAGFPLESLLHAYRLGTEVTWRALLAEARETSPRAVEALVNEAVHVMQVLDFMSMGATDEYRRRELEAERRDSERRQAVLDSLLEGRGGDPRVEADARQELGIAPEPRLAVVVLAKPERPMQSPRDPLAAHGFASQWRLRADHMVGLIDLGKEPLDRLLARLADLGETPAAASPEVTSLVDVASAYRFAELALRTLDADDRRVVTLDERLPEALLAASPALARRIDQKVFGRLHNVEAEWQEALLTTLESWYRHNRSSADVSEELHCHRNTVLHRLSRIEELTGLALDDSRNELMFRLALLGARP